MPAAIAFAFACGDTAAPVSQLPTMPALPIATPRTGEIVVSWQDASHNETGFRVGVRSGGGPWLLLAETAANTTSATHPNVLHQVLYSYRIAACNNAGCTDWIETSGKWETGEPPAFTSLFVSQLRADNATARATIRTGGLDTHIVFTFRRAGSATGLQIGPVTLRASMSGGPVVGQLTFVDGTAFGLEPETSYSVTAIANNAVGSALSGEPVPFRTRPLTPVVFQDFAVTILADNVVQLRVGIDQLGVETEVVGEVVAAVAIDFREPIASQRVVLAPQLGLRFTTMAFSGLESGKDYKARMVLRNSAGSVTTPVRTFRMP